MSIATKEENVERAQLVRVHEANCQIDHPSVDELNFRLATMKRIAVSFGLRELRDKTITGPATAQTAIPSNRRS